MSTGQAGGLNVIALVSGGKDSFFSLLHCRANGHRVVALANLHPALSSPLGPLQASSPPATISVAPAAIAAAAAPVPVLAASGCGPCEGPSQDGTPAASVPGRGCGVRGNEVLPDPGEDEHDLNSFMYQTVGHQVIPLYAEVTGIPMYRRAITGGATQHAKDYSHYELPSRTGPGTASTPDGEGRPGRTSGLAGPAEQDAQEADETESMVPLLQAIKAAHPEANAICAGAVLSTYQRTRVESVATRLGLTPLAYLWKFPVLPAPAPSDPAAGSDAQLLDDMAAAGLEARIVKVASGGLDDSFLWTNVASPAGKAKVARAMRRFGTAETGAVIGEGGEFETLVLDGPSTLFRKRIVVAEEDQQVVREGGGSAWLKIRSARLEDKTDADGRGAKEPGVRIPDLLDPKFESVLEALWSIEGRDGPCPGTVRPSTLEIPPLGRLQPSGSGKLQQWTFASPDSPSIEGQTQSIVQQIRRRLQQHSLPPSAILSATVVLRRMSDFPAVNSIYGTLFDAPNPPSRVTISCGDNALSATATGAEGAAIAVSLAVHAAPSPAATQPQHQRRRGLHVQSRSYWAPANIGPYSQAISVPVASFGSADADDDPGPRLVTIAGQIPLVPATMALPEWKAAVAGGDPLCLQIALSLQHLWRVGVEMGVQWWTSAVAYLPRAAAGDDDDDAGRLAVRARLAAAAWERAHRDRPGLSGDDDDGGESEEEESGPDLWDRRFNPAYMSYAGEAAGLKPPPGHGPLPDREVLVSASKDAVPPLFVAEVDELPRGAGVEWHAHLGIAEAGAESVVVRDVPQPGANDHGDGAVTVSQVIVLGTGAEPRVNFVQTIVAERLDGAQGGGDHGGVVSAALTQLGEVGPAASGELQTAAVMARYVDVEALRGAADGEVLGLVVPCKSLWDAEGRRLSSLTVYQSVFEGSSRRDM